MSPPAAPRGGTRGPRRAPGPRAGAPARGAGGAHGPGGPRGARRASAPGYAARELEPFEPDAPVAVTEADAGVAPAPRGRRRRGEDARARRAERARARRERRELEERERAAREPEPTGELSGLRLLLDQLDALLRDPTLTLALKRFTGGIADGLRGMAAALRLPRLRRPRWLRLPRLPAWLLAPLLALLLGLGLISLLSGGGDDRRTGNPAGGEIALPGVGMPALQAAPDDPPPARVALVVDDTYAPAELRHELQSLGAWLAANHAPGTRVTLIDSAGGRALGPLSAAELAGPLPAGRRATTGTAITDAFRGTGGRRLLVGVGAPAPRSAATTLTVATRPGAATSAATPVRRGGRGRVTIDARRPDALAAGVARALIGISGQRERR